MSSSCQIQADPFWKGFVLQGRKQKVTIFAKLCKMAVNMYAYQDNLNKCSLAAAGCFIGQNPKNVMFNSKQHGNKNFTVYVALL